jgi:hypothetical protein
VMEEKSVSLRQDVAVPLLWGLGSCVAGLGCLAFLLYSLLQPTRFPNAGLEAYAPPLGTQLLPIPRKSDAPELVNLPVQETSAFVTLAQQPSADGEVKRTPDRRPRKVVHAAVPRRHEQREAAYSQQWSPWGQNGGNAGGHNSSGGFWVGSRNWF